MYEYSTGRLLNQGAFPNQTVYFSRLHEAVERRGEERRGEERRGEERRGVSQVKGEAKIAEEMRSEVHHPLRDAGCGSQRRICWACPSSYEASLLDRPSVSVIAFIKFYLLLYLSREETTAGSIFFKGMDPRQSLQTRNAFT
ncbi:hypothetical protein llap_16463 [Limosa lapponica baueri]|uniref:Uncharacterized protein n=1 Tax=Limosa lapponica baueri TaxID=1758121 RepID=A0A2I0THL6_LIMLA|nr:hypothetical protein llap_16463 [Limosa lapponica baueri]